MPPVLVVVLPLVGGVPLCMIVCFLGAIDARERHFEEGLVGKEGNLECRFNLSMNHQFVVDKSYYFVVDESSSQAV